MYLPEKFLSLISNIRLESRADSVYYIKEYV